MKKRKFVSLCMVFYLVGTMGCNSRTSDQKEAATQQSEQSQSEDTKEIPKEEEGAADPAGTGFTPPKGSHKDRNGNIVDPEGNTFDEEGGWTVPEGGRVDSSGRIYDKNGKVMGGGATIGSKG